MSLLSIGPAQKALWGLLIVLVLAYMGGGWLNRRRSKALGRWVQSGLKTLGGQPSWKWIGSMASGGQVTVTNAARPFRQLQLTYLLLTREFFPLWGVERLRGKRDMLTVRGDLRGDLGQEIEVVPLHGRLRSTLDSNPGEQPWHWEEAPAGLGLATRNVTDPRLISAVKGFLEQYGADVQRLSLRRRQPNLIMFIHLDGLEHTPADGFMRALQRTIGAQTPSP
jgi:hypothetical protein